MMGRRRTNSFWTQNKVGLIILGVSLFFMCVFSCFVMNVLIPMGNRGDPESAPQRVAGELYLAYSPEKADLMDPLIQSFNSERYRTPAGDRMVIHADAVDPSVMIQLAIEGNYHVVSPDSSIWLSQIDRAWMDAAGSEVPLVGHTFRFAVSPIVIAMWEDTARSMGYPEKPVGWQSILNRAQSDDGFRWSHPSTGTASGLLATLAQFYAGAGKTRNLTQEDALAEATLEYVSAIQKTVRYYGEGESALVQRALNEGPAFLDAFVVQEQKVIHFNRRSDLRLVAVYPYEGTLWEDHPMALLELPDLTEAQRLVFTRWQEYLLSPDNQALMLSLGYRPADLSIPLDSPGSPFTPANGVDPREPQTALQMPAPNVIEVVQNAWWYTKRQANIILVVDVSGSMRGRKLMAVQEALKIFLGQIQGEQEAVGLIQFSTYVDEVVPLGPLSQNRQRLVSAIDAMKAEGQTALLDAVDLAHYRLQALGDAERINAVVVMTDGLENKSQLSLQALERRLREGEREGVAVIIFCIAYGTDADYDALNRIAGVSGGQVREGNLETIQQLYKILSTYF